MQIQDAGLATRFWHGYFSDEEVDRIQRVTTTTMFVSGDKPIHVRMYLHSEPAPVIVMGSPMLLYGLLLAPLQLRMFEAGFNIIQWDLPGWGQSGGSRSGCPADEIVATWRTSLDFAAERFDPPFFVMGLAEDGVTAYYACANRPDVAALSVHNLFEYGDPEAIHWHGPLWYQKVKEYVSRAAAVSRPELGLDAYDILPWETVFASSTARHFWQRFENDPLRTPGFQFSLIATLIKANAPPTPFEECQTPVQVIASEKSDLWPYQMNLRYYNRLGGPKEFATLAGHNQWDVTSEFYDEYAENVARWFKNYPESDVVAGPVTASEPRNMEDAGLAGNFWKEYYEPDEIRLILDRASTTMIASGGLPIHIRQFVHDPASPTVILSNPLPAYGLAQARMQLPFFRAGFNVLQFDAPGTGQSGGPRGGCRETDFIRAWDRVVSFARRRFSGPLYGAGIAEDGLYCYMSQANRANLQAICLHSLLTPSQMVRSILDSVPPAVGSIALRAGAAIRPTTKVNWLTLADVQPGGPGDDDPLVLHQLDMGMIASIGHSGARALPFERCTTPIQVVSAGESGGTADEFSRKNVGRLESDSELVEIDGPLVWPYERATAELFCEQAIRWFQQHGASDVAGDI